MMLQLFDWTGKGPEHVNVSSLSSQHGDQRGVGSFAV
jgi:hypothetical protein